MKINLLKLLPLAVILVSGCSIGKRQEVGVYTLNPQISSVKTVGHCAADIQIISPTTSPGLDSRRIAVMQNDNKLNYYNNVRWVDSVPTILRNLLVEAFEKSNAFDNITSETDTANADMLLLTDVRNYEVITQDGFPAVKLRIIAKLVNRSNYKVIKTIPVETTVKPAENKIDSIIEAFNKGSLELTEKILKASAQACNK